LSQEEEQQSTSSAQISVTSQLQKTGNDVEVNTQLLIPSEKQSLLSSQSSRTEENMPTNNVTASEKDNHISGSEESAISPQKQEDQTISQEDDDELEWHDVGIVRGTKCNIYHYYVPTDMVDQHVWILDINYILMANNKQI
jgi:hypothetical protein